LANIHLLKNQGKIYLSLSAFDKSYRLSLSTFPNMRFVLIQSNCVVGALELKDISVVLKKSLILKTTFLLMDR